MRHITANNSFQAQWLPLVTAGTTLHATDNCHRRPASLMRPYHILDVTCLPSNPRVYSRDSLDPGAVAASPQRPNNASKTIKLFALGFSALPNVSAPALANYSITLRDTYKVRYPRYRRTHISFCASLQRLRHAATDILSPSLSPHIGLKLKGSNPFAKTRLTQRPSSCSLCSLDQGLT